ncbi:aldo/keto reductase [Vallitalea sp.]|uniref:aldo/keto reductase n=1 Tax=Vallitalea sp. TaxID=1882829 RepID=UPI00260098DF|nr:aldo/keto reductase [Vallitalea sp.]MCT4686247.1 aldo/keto reductase [Vallitalea sp.]
MIYRPFGNTDIQLSALSIGTNRFSPNDLKDNDGLERAAEIVCEAINNGVNYIDTSYIYSQRKAERILNIAFKNIKKEFHVTTKARFDMDKTADDVLRRIENSLKVMGVNKSTFFCVWYIKSYQEYEQIMKKGGLYEGAIKAKNRGLISHICFSTHAVVPDIIKIINEGAFEGVTISYSLLNYKIMDQILRVARCNNMGIITMNSLGGGIIPSNNRFFDFIRMSENESVVQAALKFIYSHKEITSMLSGMATLKELNENLSAFKGVDKFENQRSNYVNLKINNLDGYCTGCNYCTNCPAGIPISDFMQSYNTLFFSKESSICRCKDIEIAKKINLFHKIKFDFNIILNDNKNPCINCGACEKKCTQKLPIQQRISEIYEMSEKCCYNISAKKKRMEQLKCKDYKCIGFYPAGVATNNFLNLYRDLFGKLDFIFCVFDSNPSLWGKQENNYLIHNPDEIDNIKPDCIIITNYNYTDEIFNGLKHYTELGIEIIKLYRKDDVPWLIM